MAHLTFEEARQHQTFPVQSSKEIQRLRVLSGSARITESLPAVCREEKVYWYCPWHLDVWVENSVKSTYTSQVKYSLCMYHIVDYFTGKKLSQSSHFCCNSWKLYPQKSTWNQFWILQHPRTSHVMCINYSTFNNILYHNLQIVHMHTRCHLWTMHMHTRCHLQISREPNLNIYNCSEITLLSCNGDADMTITWKLSLLLEKLHVLFHTGK